MFVVITKIDMVEGTDKEKKNKLKSLMTFIKNELRVHKVYLADKNTPQEMLNIYAENLQQQSICPVFWVSNKTGEGIQKLKSFLARLPKYDSYATQV